jgi:hypothetical protein
MTKVFGPSKTFFAQTQLQLQRLGTTLEDTPASYFQAILGLSRSKILPSRSLTGLHPYKVTSPARPGSLDER